MNGLPYVWSGVEEYAVMGIKTVLCTEYRDWGSVTGRGGTEKNKLSPTMYETPVDFCIYMSILFPLTSGTSTNIDLP